MREIEKLNQERRAPHALDALIKAADHHVPLLESNAVRVLDARVGLSGYGASLPELACNAGGYVAKILQGAKPNELPVEQSAKFELPINMKTAKPVGVAVPHPNALRVRADRLIE